MLLIIYAIFTFDKKTPYPSFYTLIPTIGTALVIIFATKQTVVGRLLANKALVGIGLISYSAYLWHQPLFAFARYSNVGDTSTFLLMVLVLFSFAFAYFNWKFIETPFRNKSTFTQNQIFLFSFIGILFFIAAGLAGQFSKGFEQRIDSEKREFLSYFENSIPEMKYLMGIGAPEKFRFECDFYDIEKYRNGHPTGIPVDNISDVCFVKKSGQQKTVFLWGDSHARQLYPGLKSTMPKEWQILQVTSSGCEAKLNARENKRDYCEYSNWFAYKTIVKTKPDVVVVGQNLNHSAGNMNAIGNELIGAGVKKVVFTGPTPHWIADLPQIIVRKIWLNTPQRTKIGLDIEVMKLDKKVRANFNNSSFMTYVSMVDYFCNVDGCFVYLGLDKKTGITTYDYGHLTPIASHFFAKDVLVKEIIDISE